MQEIYQYIDIEYTLAEELPVGKEDEVLVRMRDYLAQGRVNTDRTTGSLSFAVAEVSPELAILQLDGLLKSVRAALGELTVTAIEVMNEDTRRARQLLPSRPVFVSYDEIAEMARVTRAVAREYTRNSGFPLPLQNTQLGPMYDKSAVQRWLDSRKPESGGFRILNR